MLLTYIRTCIGLRTYIPKYMHTYMRTYVHKYLHMYIHTIIHTYMHNMYIHTCRPTCTSYIQGYTHIHIYTYSYSCIHTNICTIHSTYILHTYMNAHINDQIFCFWWPLTMESTSFHVSLIVWNWGPPWILSLLRDSLKSSQGFLHWECLWLV